MQIVTEGARDAEVHERRPGLPMRSMAVRRFGHLLDEARGHRGDQ
jgi:hypothetical protein